MAIHPGLNSRYTVDQKKGEKTMAYLKGYVDHIRFRNEDNGYTVLSLDVDGDEETVVGSFPFLNFFVIRFASAGPTPLIAPEPK